MNDTTTLGRDVILVLTILSKGTVAYTQTVTWRYRHIDLRKRRSALKKIYDFVRFPIEALSGKRKQAWKRITDFHKTISGIIEKEFDNDVRLRLANLYNTIRFCSIFKD